MEKALLNTAMGMGVVFCVLIFISVVIWLLGFIPKLIDVLSKKKTTDTVQSSQASTPVQEAVSNTTDDTELVAVIAAALAATLSATTGQYVSPDGLVIRSIKKRR